MRSGIVGLAGVLVVVVFLGDVGRSQEQGREGMESAAGGAAPTVLSDSRMLGWPSSARTWEATAAPTLWSDVRMLGRMAIGGLNRLAGWYRATPPADRMVWGGLVGCGLLAGGVFLERILRVRPNRVIPRHFTSRFVDRIHEGRLDCGAALDHCARHPSPAARVAMAALHRWGRPAADLERAVLLAQRVETDRLRRNVGSLRRVAALAPLLGLLGTLLALGRALESAPGSVGESAAVHQVVDAAVWGKSVARALSPLTVGIVIAALALVGYDALAIRVERLEGGLERLGAETIDAIAMAAPLAAPLARFGRSSSVSGEAQAPAQASLEGGEPPMEARTPHQQARRQRAIGLAGQSASGDTV